MSYTNWTIERRRKDGIAWLCIDKPGGSADTLSADGADGTRRSHLAELEQDLPKGVVLYSGKESGFIMGADINEFVRIEIRG